MPWKERKGKKRKKKGFLFEAPILVLYYPHLGKSNNGQTQPTLSLAYLYYGVGLLQSETSAGTSLGWLVITSNIKWEQQYKVGAIPIPVPNSGSFPSRKDPGLSPLATCGR